MAEKIDENVLDEATLDTTGDTNIGEEEAMAIKESKLASLPVTSIDIPQLAEANVGDTIEMVVRMKVTKADKDNDDYEVQPINFTPTSDYATENAESSPEQSPLAGSDISSLLSGVK